MTEDNENIFNVERQQTLLLYFIALLFMTQIHRKAIQFCVCVCLCLYAVVCFNKSQTPASS